jgi:hypothetical protein
MTRIFVVITILLGLLIDKMYLKSDSWAVFVIWMIWMAGLPIGIEIILRLLKVNPSGECPILLSFFFFLIKIFKCSI